MNISNEGIALIKKFEGCKLESYYDAVDVLTIAYGRTKAVKAGDTCTQEQAGYVNDAVKVDLTQNQFDALTAWTYNLGPTNLNSSSMLTKINEKDWDEVPNQIKRWNKAGGKVLEGLVRRREAEAKLFEGLEWSDI